MGSVEGDGREVSKLSHAYDAMPTATTLPRACPISAAFRSPCKFTGKERETESGLDEFGARYYASSFGRFMTPDWATKPISVGDCVFWKTDRALRSRGDGRSVGWPRLLGEQASQTKLVPRACVLCKGGYWCRRHDKSLVRNAPAPQAMTSRVLSTTLMLGLFAVGLSGCGGGNATSTAGGSGGGGGGIGGGGGGGGGGGTGLSISMLAPSTVMVGVQLGFVTVFGQGFTAGSQVLIDGRPSQLTDFIDSATLQAEIDPSLVNYTAGTHQFSVQNGGQLSNALPYTVYAPQQGPFVMRAIPGFLAGGSDAPFIVAADIDGDGLADVIIPGPDLSSSGSIAILRGQADGTLAAVQFIPCPVPGENSSFKTGK